MIGASGGGWRASLRVAAGLQSALSPVAVVLLFVLLVPLASSPAGAETPAPEAAPGPAAPQPTAVADTSMTTIGGRLKVMVDVPTPEGWFVEPLELESRLGPFAVRTAEETDRTSEGRRLLLTLVALEEGDVEVPPIELTLRAADGEEVTVTTEAIPVRVGSNIAEEERLPDPADPEAEPAEPEAAPDRPAVPAPRDWLPVWVASAAALAALVLALLLFRWLRSRRPAESDEELTERVPTRPAWEVALEELERIGAAGFVDRGDLRREYEETTFVLRRYLEDRYGVPALESTTDELRLRLRRAPLAPEQTSRALTLLSEADLVKFAKAEPEPTDARHASRRVRDIVVATTPTAHPAKERAA